MTALRQAATDYLTTRRAVGYTLGQEGRLLAGFVDFLEARNITRVTINAALEWATLPHQAHPNWWAQRLSVVRGFARWLATLDAATQIPPRDLLAGRIRASTPYLYSPAQVRALMHAAATLTCPLRAATFEAFIGLMAATGLRTGEAIRLDREDVNPDEETLTVRRSKLGRSRHVPLHPTTAEALASYAQRRDTLCLKPAAPSFFLSGAGTRLTLTNTSSTFADLRDTAGITAPPGQRRPRLYDLRHSFAVSTLATWYADGVDVPRRLPALSTYLGHVKPSSTYWYLQASPELMAAAASRLEQFWQEGAS